MYDNQSEKERLVQLFTTYKSSVIVGCMLQFFQQFVGINTIMYYGPQIIIDLGIGGDVEGQEDEMVGTFYQIFFAATNSVGSCMALFLIEYYGRRSVMLKTLPFTCISLVVISFSIQRNDKLGSMLILSSIIVYLASFAIGMSSTIWAVTQEIFPIQLVGTAVSLANATGWICNFAVASVFLTSMETDGGKTFTFLFLALMVFCAFVFIYVFVPETAGKTI